MLVLYINSMDSIILKDQDIEVYDQLINLIIKYNLLNEITLTEIETITKDFNSLNKYIFEGSVSVQKSEDVYKLKEELKDVLIKNSMCNIDDVFKVSLGHSVGDSIDTLNLSDSQSKTHSIYLNNNVNNEFSDTSLIVPKDNIKKLNILYLWSIYNKKFNTELQFIELKNILKESNINAYVNQYMICGDINYNNFKEFIISKNWDLFITQYYSQSIFYELNIIESPTIIITDYQGIIKYRGSPYSLDIIASIKSMLNNYEYADSNNIIRETGICKTDNLWWNELDIYGKKEVVYEMNMSLNDVGLINLQFAVILQKVFYNNEISYYIIPVITGNININNEEDQLLNQFIKDIEETLSFKNIQIDVNYNNEINKASNFEILKNDESSLLEKDVAAININK